MFEFISLKNRKIIRVKYGIVWLMFSNMCLVRYIAQFLVFLISLWFLADFYVIVRTMVGLKGTGEISPLSEILCL